MKLFIKQLLLFLFTDQVRSNIQQARQGEMGVNNSGSECMKVCNESGNQECNCGPKNAPNLPLQEELEELNYEIDCLENCENEVLQNSIPGGSIQCDSNENNCMQPGNGNSGIAPNGYAGDHGIEMAGGRNENRYTSQPMYNNNGMAPPVMYSPALPAPIADNMNNNNRMITIRDKITAVITSLITSTVASPPLILTQAAVTVTYTQQSKPVVTTLPPLVFQIPTTIYRTAKAETIEKTIPPQIIYQPPVTSTIHHQIEYPPSTIVISTTLPAKFTTVLVPGPAQTVIKYLTSKMPGSTVTVQGPAFVSTVSVLITSTAKSPPKLVPYPVTVTVEGASPPPRTVTVPVQVPVTVLQQAPPQPAETVTIQMQSSNGNSNEYNGDNSFDQPQYNQPQYNQPQSSQPQYNQPQSSQPQMPSNYGSPGGYPSSNFNSSENSPQNYNNQSQRSPGMACDCTNQPTAQRINPNIPQSNSSCDCENNSQNSVKPQYAFAPKQASPQRPMTSQNSCKCVDSGFAPLFPSQNGCICDQSENPRPMPKSIPEQTNSRECECEEQNESRNSGQDCECPAPQMQHKIQPVNECDCNVQPSNQHINNEMCNCLPQPSMQQINQPVKMPRPKLIPQTKAMPRQQEICDCQNKRPPSGPQNNANMLCGCPFPAPRPVSYPQPRPRIAFVPPQRTGDCECNNQQPKSNSNCNCPPPVRRQMPAPRPVTQEGEGCECENMRSSVKRNTSNQPCNCPQNIPNPQFRGHMRPQPIRQTENCNCNHQSPARKNMNQQNSQNCECPQPPKKVTQKIKRPTQQASSCDCNNQASSSGCQCPNQKASKPCTKQMNPSQSNNKEVMLEEFDGCFEDKFDEFPALPNNNAMKYPDVIKSENMDSIASNEPSQEKSSDNETLNDERTNSQKSGSSNLISESDYDNYPEETNN